MNLKKHDIMCMNIHLRSSYQKAEGGMNLVPDDFGVSTTFKELQ